MVWIIINVLALLSKKYVELVTYNTLIHLVIYIDVGAIVLYLYIKWSFYQNSKNNKNLFKKLTKYQTRDKILNVLMYIFLPSVLVMSMSIKIKERIYE